MGGAADVAPEAVRTPKAKANAGENQDALEQAKDKGRQDVVSTGPKKAVVKAGQDDKVAEAKGAGEHQGDGSDDNATDDQAPPAEKHEGWGVQDWYDAADQAEEQKQIEQELQAAKQRLRIDPNDRDALSVLAYYQYLSEDFGGALGTYQKFIKNYPDDPAGYNNLALVYKRQKRYADEEPLYHLALALSPNDTTALDNLAVNLAHQGRYPEALRIMQRLAVLDPGDPYADLHRAKIHAAMGDDEQAYYFLDRACAGMKALDTLHMIEFRQDIRVDPAFEKIRETRRFHDILTRYYGKDTPLQE
jgi:tetratricopeptide (TPR) repeat protein